MATNISRNKQHELIMTCIYDALTQIEMGETFSVEEIIANTFGCSYEEAPLFAKEIVVKSLAHLDEIRQAFQDNMPKWRFERLNVVERAILIMSYTHKHYVEDSQKAIIIDVAIRLAKNYLDKDDYKFVNAILDNVL